MPTFLPDDHFLSSPRAPHAQLLAHRIRARVDAMKPHDETIEQSNLYTMPEAVIDLQNKELFSSEFSF